MALGRRERQHRGQRRLCQHLAVTAPRPCWAHDGPKPLTFVLTQQQGGCQPSIHNGLLVQDGGGGGRELGAAYSGEEGGEQATWSQPLTRLSPPITHDCGPFRAPGCALRHRI